MRRSDLGFALAALVMAFVFALMHQYVGALLATVASACFWTLWGFASE